MRRNLPLIGIIVGCLAVGVAIAAVIIYREATSSPARPPSSETQAIELCQQAVRDRLKDPESARFRNDEASGAGLQLTVKGQVNARTPMGGYGGYNTYTCSADTATNNTSSVDIEGNDN